MRIVRIGITGVIEDVAEDGEVTTVPVQQVEVVAGSPAAMNAKLIPLLQGILAMWPAETGAAEESAGG